ncbi:MAG: methyltransferase [Candidatus Riflebacteria bacterium]|nr:methyltransferase [Candidatus Riflebacteria bacterium]
MNNMEWNPKRLLETSGNYWLSCTLHAAVKIDVFTALADKELTGVELAKKTRCDKRGLIMLLNAVTAMQLLKKKGEKYLNSPASKTFLSKDSPKYLGHIIMHHHHLVESWEQLDKAIITGKPVRKRSSSEDKEDNKVRESFLMGMFNMAMNIAPYIVSQIDLSGRTHFLDLGGGPGTYAIHFCLENPELKATIFDFPTTKPFAQKTIKKFDLSKRIDFQAGNFTVDEIKGKYDVAWLSHVLHSEGPDECQRVIDKTAAVLEPGGMLMVHEFILDKAMSGPLFPALFSMNMLLGTSEGQSYSDIQLKEMLKKAGLKKIKRLDFCGPNDSGIIVGIK